MFRAERLCFTNRGAGMRRLRFAWCASLLSFTLSVSSLEAQSPPVAPPRDRQAPAATGTARIRGRVIAADTGRPIRRATVRISSPELRDGVVTTTDSDGRYEFGELPAGRFNVTATKSGYVGMGYRQTRPNTSPTPVSLTDGEVRERIDITLLAGGVITGRVVDEFGDPLPDVMVSARRMQLFAGGARRPFPVGTPDTSNDIGEFRIFGLPPGEYYVSATPRGPGTPSDVNRDRTGYVPTNYPSEPNIGAAQRVVVGAGLTVSNIVIVLTPTRVSRVSGVALDAEGRPLRLGTVLALPRFGYPPASWSAQIRPDGSFTFGALPPDDYVLRTIPNGPVEAAAPMWSAASVTVGDSDISNVVLQPQRAVTIRGRLTGAPDTLSRVVPQTTRIVASRAEPTPLFGPAPPPPSVHEDLTFEVQAPPGRTLLRAAGLNGVAIHAIRWQGRDLTASIDVQAAVPMDDVDIEVAPATARVTVTVSTRDGAPVADRDIVIFPQDEALWEAVLPAHWSAGQTDDEGRFQSPALVAGAYYVAVTRPLEYGEATDPEFLETIRASASRLVLRDDETATVALQAPMAMAPR